MLKRIQDIKSIGCFFDDHPAAIQFEPLTFIFGENCYGKSTLCDILRSLADNNPDYITDRESIPNLTNQYQLVRLNFSLPNGGREYQVIFHRDQWNPQLQGDLKIHVFDTDFIHRNVFTGLTIERRNQENITRFVLGESGVRTAKDIKDSKSNFRAMRKEIRQLNETVFADIKDIIAFLAMQVNESNEEIQEEILNKSEELKSKKELEHNIEEAKDREEPQLLSIPENIESFVNQVNTCLASAYRRAHDDASMAVERHIKAKTKNTPTTKAWLKTGLDHVAGDHCPFCGQTLEEEAKSLIEFYRSCFDDAYDKYERETRANLGQLPSQMNDYKCLSIPELLHKNSSNFIIYPELTKTSKYGRNTKLVSAITKGLRKLWDTFQTKFDEESKKLNGKLRHKEMAIYIKNEPWTCPGLIKAYDNFRFSTLKYNEVVQRIIDQITEFKTSLIPETIANEISEIEKQKKQLELKKKRKDSDQACRKLIDLQIAADETEKKIDLLQEQLKAEQSQFLSTYFDSINRLFVRLGSGPFQIAKQISERGNMPVVELTASYADVSIGQDKLQAFFSESDRRALALSVFWAKIESLDEHMKQNGILVLDDPVTSFDDGRIDRTIRLMESNRPAFRQIIILSHYPMYLKSFFERASLNTSGIQLLKIVRSQDSSTLETASAADFVETEHHIKFRHIKDFIDRKHTENVCQDLRIFLATEVKSRYRKQITENDLSALQFKDLLNELYERGIIDQNKKTELEGYRLSLNPDHHTWTGRSQEDKIALSLDVLEFIYERM